MKICKERFRELLRFGRKHDGPWSECGCDNRGHDNFCYLPDDDDIDYIMEAIEFYKKSNLRV